ncbi:YjbQ family protein [candidate division KSB1 bacterium]|nr:YjbQ family protein [candidate division KSB1 bacterium]TDI85847.1 MAG: YjbQ family protein [Caldithrix sp.]
MKVVTSSFEISTKGHTHIIDVTGDVQDLLRQSSLSEGHLTVFVAGSTAGITSIEYEPGLLKDLPAAFEQFAPTGVTYHHDATWGDGNGYAHVRAALLGPSFDVPFQGGKLILGTWQQIVIIDFDNRPRHRNIIVQVIGV